MKTINKLRNRKGVSPVIATVILVAVTITVAVAVAYWMSGIAGQYTSFEKVEIQTGYSTIDPLGAGWLITLELKNTGSATATITHLFINDVPVPATGAATWAGTDIIVTDLIAAGLPITAGAPVTVKIWIDLGYGSLSSGTTINVKLHSAGGMDYIRLVKLA